MKTTAKYMIIPLVAVVLSSCGGGGGSDAPSNNDPVPAQPTATPAPNPTPTPAPDTPVATAGSDLYMKPNPEGNSFACVHCHSLNDPADDGFARPGHAIGDAVRRESYKNGELSELVDAVNICLETWMTVPSDRLWDNSNADYLKLKEFLESRDSGSGVAPPITFAKVDPISFDNNQVNGNAADGQQKFNTSCAICHSENAVGSQAAPDLNRFIGRPSQANFIAQKVRLSGPLNHDIYDGTAVGGLMPFWGGDRLSNADLTDIAAFLVSDRVNLGTPNGGGDTGGNGDGKRSCSSTHPKIGQVATFTTRDHQVSGTATITDDCTIVIDNFNYDGAGIQVTVYGADNSGFRSGFSMSDNLLRPGGYSNERLEVQLPEGKTLDDLDYLSIWCVPVGLSFGDGKFM